MAVLTDYQQALMKFLQSTLTQSRMDRFEEVLQLRTRWLTVVIADIFLEHNASAVLRSCEACGVQDVHIVESYNAFQANEEIALGAEKWLTLSRYHGRQAPDECVSQLRSRGYRIVATSPHGQAVPIHELSLDGPLALFFGNEKTGLDQQILEAADETTFLPMAGFVESFNISVAAALCVFELTRRIRSSPVPWQLSVAEKELLRYEWTCNGVAHLPALVRRFDAEWSPGP